MPNSNNKDAHQQPQSRFFKSCPKCNSNDWDQKLFSNQFICGECGNKEQRKDIAKSIKEVVGL